MAMEKALVVSTRIGALAVEVIATDENAAEFYRHHGDVRAKVWTIPPPVRMIPA